MKVCHYSKPFNLLQPFTSLINIFSIYTLATCLIFLPLIHDALINLWQINSSIVAQRLLNIFNLRRFVAMYAKGM